MMRIAALLLTAALSADVKQKVNPVEKVTELLEKLQAEIEEEGKKEAKAYDDFACFCKEQADNKQYAIEKFIEQENVLKAKIEDKSAKKAVLDEEVVELKKEIETLEGEQQEASEVRADQHGAYADRSSALATAIDRMQRAIAALRASKDQMVDSHDGYTLLSKYEDTIKRGIALADSMHIVHNGEKLLSMLAQPGKPHAYSYHSNEVIATLESLLKNFKQKATQVDNEERETKQTHEMAAGARANIIKKKEKSKTEKMDMSAELDMQLNQHQTELQQTEDAHAADQNFLDDLTVKCETKAKDFDQRSNSRSNELQAIAKALELLKGDVAGNYGTNDLGLATKGVVRTKAVAALVETPETSASDETEDPFEEELHDDPPSFLQLRKPNNAAKNRVVGFILKANRKINSPVLSSLAVKLQDAPTPFAKVKQMISDLITRLEEEAEAEADQKAWCDENMEETTKERDEAQREIEKLRASITEKHALVAQLTEHINDLSTGIAELQKALNEETELREKEAAENQLTLEEAEAGLEAVKGAIEVLNAYYNPSLLQQNPAPAAEGYERFSAEGAGSDGKTVDDLAPDAGGVEGEYSGKKDASNSIIALMEQIKEDFENTLTDTDKMESDAQADYDTFKGETETDISDKGELKTTKENDRETAELDISTAMDDKKKQEGLLQAALDELEKLHPVCVDTGMSHEERVARREQEIDALKKALVILQETDFGF